MTSSTQNSPNTKTCPVCEKPVTGDLRQCSHCGAVLGLVSPRLWNRKLAGFLSVVLPGVGQMYKMKILLGAFWFISVVCGYGINVLVGLPLHTLCVLHAMSGDPTKET